MCKTSTGSLWIAYALLIKVANLHEELCHCLSSRPAVSMSLLKMLSKILLALKPDSADLAM